MAPDTATIDAPAPHLFLRVRFEVPRPADDGGDENSDDVIVDGTIDGAAETGETGAPSVVTTQCFDATSCESPAIGLPDGVEPVKV